MGLLNMARRGVGKAIMDATHQYSDGLGSRAFGVGEDMFRRGFQAKKEELAMRIMMSPAETPAGQMWNRELADMIRTAPDEPSLQAILQRMQAGQQRYGAGGI